VLVLGVYAPSEEKRFDSKDSCHEELEQVFIHIPKYHMKFVLGYFNAKLETEDIFKPTVGIENLHQHSNDNAVNSKLCRIKKSSTVVPHRNIHQ
jgi:hypothetical protein